MRNSKPKDDHEQYLLKVREEALRMRDNPTPSETAFRAILVYLREKHGIDFEQSYVVSINPEQAYILDFYIPAFKLGIEIDGAYHEARAQKKRDISRDERVHKMGIQIARYTNAWTMNDLPGIFCSIVQRIFVCSLLAGVNTGKVITEPQSLLKDFSKTHPAKLTLVIDDFIQWQASQPQTKPLKSGGRMKDSPKVSRKCPGCKKARPFKSFIPKDGLAETNCAVCRRDGKPDRPIVKHRKIPSRKLQSRPFRKVG